MRAHGLGGIEISAEYFTKSFLGIRFGQYRNSAAQWSFMALSSSFFLMNLSDVIISASWHEVTRMEGNLRSRPNERVFKSGPQE